MRCFFVGIVAALVLFLGPTSLRSAPRLVELEGVSELSESELLAAANSRSILDTDGGYKADPRVVARFAAMEYRPEDGRPMTRFRMYSPPRLVPGTQYPAILWLHGAGESGDDNRRQLAHMQRALEFFSGNHPLEGFVIVPQCPKNNPNWTALVEADSQGDTPLSTADAILEAAIEEYPIDRNCLTVIGICSGGSAAWEYVAAHPGRFAGLAVCSASPPENISVEGLVATPFWSFHNKDDGDGGAGSLRLMARLYAAGGSGWVTLHETGGHDSWTGALKHDRIVGWLAVQNRRAFSPPPGAILYRRSGAELFGLFGLPLVAIGAFFAGRIFLRRKTSQETEAP